jgi:hypothetical protein
MLGQIESYVGTYFSKEYVKKNILRLTDEEIDEIDGQIENEGGGEDDAGGDDFYAQNDPTKGE